jgi:esterase
VAAVQGTDNPVVAGGGIELHTWELGRGVGVLCIHETATTAAVWRPLAEALGERARTIAYDRRGWGRSTAPEPYERTTIGEQSEDAAAVLTAAAAGPAVLCGAGVGAVVALDLLLRRPELSLGAVLVEPPLLAFVTDATAQLSEDAAELRRTAATGGPRAALELYLSGGLPALGGGAGRLPEAVSAPSRERPLTLFAELPAVSAWPLPLAELALAQRPSLVAVCASTPPLVRAAAASLAGRLAGGELREVAGDGPPHLADPPAVAELVLEIAAG